MDAVPHELIPATDVHREDEGSLAVWSGQMEAYAIEVNKLDVET